MASPKDAGGGGLPGGHQIAAGVATLEYCQETWDPRPTLLFNGYAELVADIYRGLANERLWA
jgi:hypothetical protein